jgi:hypothetical protein
MAAQGVTVGTAKSIPGEQEPVDSARGGPARTVGKVEARAALRGKSLAVGCGCRWWAFAADEDANICDCMHQYLFYARVDRVWGEFTWLVSNH